MSRLRYSAARREARGERGAAHMVISKLEPADCGHAVMRLVNKGKRRWDESVDAQPQQRFTEAVGPCRAKDSIAQRRGGEIAREIFVGGGGGRTVGKDSRPLSLFSP